MKLFRAYLLLLGSLLAPGFAHEGHAQGTSAPVIAGDFADPSVIRVGKTYFAVGTSSEWAPHFPIYRSTNLTNWQLTGYVFDTLPAWASGSFWAPEYYFHNNTYYIYYTARRKTDNVSCIGVATSKYPDRGFQDRGIVVAYGKEAIDAFVYNDNGRLYITFKAYGLDKRPIELLGSKLSADGLKMEGEVFSLLKDDEGIGLEGQSIVQQDGTYYLFYSAGNCCGRDCSYNVRVARATRFQGPYEKQPGAPLLAETEHWKCSGHGTFVATENQELYYLYHAYHKSSHVFTGRQGMLARLEWSPASGWPTLTPTASPATAPAPLSDPFHGKVLAPHWQHDFRNATPQVRLQKGKLHLTGTFKESNPTGVVLTVRPVQDVFTMETTVTNHNDALKGLAYYGDANAALGVGVLDDQVVFWIVKENKYVVLASAAVNPNQPVSLRLVTYPDRSGKAFYLQQGPDRTGPDRTGHAWQELAAPTPTSVDYLPPWDRSPRAGLHFKGAAGTEAQFDDFVIRY